MKSNKKIILITIIIVVLLILLGVAIFFLLNGNKPPIIIDPPGPDEQDEGFAATIVVETTNIVNLVNKRNVRIEYPVLKTLEDKAFEYSINSEIAKNIEEYRKEIDTMLEGETSDTILYKYNVSYEKYTADNYMSLVISQDYQTGGMRSNKWKDIYNIDAYNNRKIYLKDLFKPNVDYQETIIEELNKQAEEQNYELVGGNGISNVPDKQKFYIKDKKLIIYFDPAEVAPYVYGELHFEMPFRYEEGYFYTE